jgi:hypothetical protein
MERADRLRLDGHAPRLPAGQDKITDIELADHPSRSRVGQTVWVMIRTFTAADAPAVDALAVAAWPGDGFMRSLHEQHGETSSGSDRTLVATEAGAIIGVASVTRHSAHPLRLNLVGTVAGPDRRGAIGTMLLDALRAGAPDDPLRVRTRPDDDAGLAFLKARGFAHLMRNQVLTVDPARRDVGAWCAARAVPEGYELVTDGLAPDDVLDLCHAIYAQGHEWNRPAPFDAVRKRRAYFAGRPDLPEPLIAARFEGQLVGVVYAECEEGNTTEVFVMPSGVLGLDRPGALEVTAAMTAQVLEWARAHSRTVVFEVDDSEAHLAAVVSELPCALREELLHLELAPPGARNVK